MKARLFLFFLCLSFGVSKAQELKASWSEMQVYDNGKDGFFGDFSGINSKYIYGKFIRFQMASPFKKNQRISKIKLVAFDKLTMKKTFTAALIGFPENKAAKEKYKDLIFYKTIVFENTVYVFWFKESKLKDELYVQSFDANLKVIKPLQKIYELSAEKGQKKKPELFVMGNKEIEDKILIGGEMAGDKNENVKIEYRLLNKDFSFEASGQVTLPYLITRRSNSLSSSYELGNDGNLHIKSFVNKDGEERKLLLKGESSAYPIISVVDLKTGVLKPLEFKFDNKNIFDFNYIIGKQTTKVFGFFCDLKKDPNGWDTHGIFYAIIDNASNTVKSINFSMFTKDQLNQLFVKDKEDQKKARRKDLKKGNDAAKSDEESLQSDYVIENVQSADNNNLVLFCSRMYNYSVTTCTTNANGGRSCTTNYYCEKSNVTAFRIDADGDIVWASNLDREITYSGWYKWDVTVINDKANFYVLYGSAYNEGATKKGKTKKKSKSMKESRDQLEYAVFSYETGKFQKRTYMINSPTTPKAERKSVNPLAIQVFENRFYFNHVKTSFKPLPTILTCAASLACPPVLLMFYNGDIYKGKGCLGTLAPMK
ncbi:MAG: hypothetical protein NT150_04315 [Bacteroidetes bacterium]|nr:hypothetical protein [Bacteroidota bacterium]